MDQPTGTSRSTVTRVLRSGAISSIVSFLLSLTIIPFVLAQTSLGTYGAWTTIGGLLAIARLTEAGVPTEVARRVAELEGAGRRDDARRVVQQAITVMLAISAGMLLLGVLVAVAGLQVVFPTVSEDQLHTLRLVWMSTVLVLVTTFVLATWFATLSGLQRQDFGAYSGLLGGVVGAVVIVVLVHAGVGIWSLFLGSLAQSLVGWAGPARGMRLVRPELTLRPARVTRAEVGALLGASSFLVAAALTTIADRQLDKLVLSHVRGPEAAAVFQLGVSLAQQPALLAALPATLVMAATAELVTNDPDRLRRFRSLSDRAAWCLGLLAAGGVAVFALDFVRLWLGAGFEDVARVAQVLSLAAVPLVLQTPWYFYVIGRGWHRIIVASSICNLVLNLAGTIALTPDYGAEGAAWGSVLGSTGSLITFYALVRRRGDETRLIHALPALVVASAATLGGLLLLPDLTSAWTFLLGTGGWAATVLVAMLVVRALPVQVVGRGRSLRVRLRRD